MESKSTNSEVASFALPLQDYQEPVEFSLLKTDKSKMENLCFCRQAVTLELWMKQTQNLKGFLKLPGMVKQSKSTKGYYKLKDLDGNILKLRVGIQHGNNGKVSSSSSGIGSLCSLTNSVSVNSDIHSLGHSLGQQQQPSTVNVKVALPELSRVYARNVKICWSFCCRKCSEVLMDVVTKLFKRELKKLLKWKVSRK